jgi:hypothetical protein
MDPRKAELLEVTTNLELGFELKDGKFYGGRFPGPCIKERFVFCDIVLTLMIYPEGNIVVGYDKSSAINNSKYGEEYRDNIAKKNYKLHMATFTVNIPNITTVELYRDQIPDNVTSFQYFEIIFTIGSDEKHTIYFNEEGLLEFSCETLAFVAFYPLFYTQPALFEPGKPSRALGEEGMSLKQADTITAEVLTKDFGRQNQWAATKVVDVKYPNTLIISKTETEFKSGIFNTNNAKMILGVYKNGTKFIRVKYSPKLKMTIELELQDKVSYARKGDITLLAWSGNVEYDFDSSNKHTLKFISAFNFNKLSTPNKLKTVVAITNMLNIRKLI